MYGIAAYFAIRNAVSEFTGRNDFPYSSPITPEKVLMNLYGKTVSGDLLTADKKTAVTN